MYLLFGDIYIDKYLICVETCMCIIQYYICIGIDYNILRCSLVVVCFVYSIYIYVSGELGGTGITCVLRGSLIPASGELSIQIFHIFPGLKFVGVDILGSHFSL